jgi:hypothetical protein
MASIASLICCRSVGVKGVKFLNPSDLKGESCFLINATLVSFLFAIETNYF